MEQREGTLQRAAVNTSPIHEIPPILHDVLRSPGQPLDAATRAGMESRFGHDFSYVRVHTDASAAASAQAIHAHAYAIGHNIVFGAGQYEPHSTAGRRLIAHELTHVLQQYGPAGKPEGVADAENPLEREARRAAASVGQHPGRGLEVTHGARHVGPPLIWRDTDPTTAATYPTAEERAQVQEIVNPQQQQAAATGTDILEVSDPAGFQSHMAARLNPYIDQVLAGAQRIQASGVVLGLPEIQGLGDIAQTQVTSFYGTYLTAAVHNPAEQVARDVYQLRTHLHEVPSVFSAQTDANAKDWVASRMHVKGADLLESYHVLSGNGARDQALFESVRDFIFNNRAADLRTIILFFPGYESGGEAYIQPRLVPEVGETPDETRRRGRWKTLGTTIHEMLHAVAHEDFSEVATALEESGIAVEGFAEYFTRPVYDRLSERAVNETPLRTSIEGTAAPYMRPPDRTGYDRYVEAVKRLRDILGGNEENLKVAYFMGHIEYLGLGGWNEAEAAQRRFPANILGAAALLTDSGQGYFQIRYTRVVLGRSGAFQIHLGGVLGYLTQNQRLGLGGSAYLQYSWPNVYVRGGLDVAGSASLDRPFGESVRLDLIPGVEAGVRIGAVRIGPGAYLVIPVAGGPISDRTVRLAAGLGLSVSF